MKSKNKSLFYIDINLLTIFCLYRTAERNIQLEEIAAKNDNLERKIIDLTNVSLNNTFT